jgi:hypothetical protein
MGTARFPLPCWPDLQGRRVLECANAMAAEQPEDGEHHHVH